MNYVLYKYDDLFYDQDLLKWKKQKKKEKRSRRTNRYYQGRKLEKLKIR